MNECVLYVYVCVRVLAGGWERGFCVYECELCVCWPVGGSEGCVCRSVCCVYVCVCAGRRVGGRFVFV